ncbi:hypothetical protein JCM19000A_08970 [Silvimonas sp. JCM 19000]
MVFSFFRKKEGDGKPDAPDSAPVTQPRAPAPHTATPAAPNTVARPTVSNPATRPAASAAAPTAAPLEAAYNLHELSIEVEDVSAHLDAEEEEAVVLHANGQTAMAAATLRGALPARLGSRRAESWALLFELYQQLNDRTAFDELALQYVVEFEASPPLWRDVVSTRPAPTAAASGTYIAFPARLNGDATAKEADRMIQAAQAGQALRLDFAKVSEIDMLAAAELLGGWLRIRKLNVPVQTLGIDSLVALLRGKIQTGRNVPAEAPFWLLLIETMQASGDQEAFETVAIDYAVTYEVSPPSWDPRHAPAAPAKTASPTAQSNVPSEHLQLSGELLHGAAGQLALIRDFAQQHSRMALDLRHVSRVDFETAGQFLNLFMEMVQTGKSVRIVCANELVAALLQMLGVSELIEIGKI